jgi:hypothetical protein
MMDASKKKKNELMMPGAGGSHLFEASLDREFVRPHLNQ